LLPICISPNFDSTKKYPAIISAHPIGSCKEQTSGNVYGEALAKAGFVVIAFDASFKVRAVVNHAILKIQHYVLRTLV
jgi:fermentation-respiration switch protein FrsA (DUF1100 family)